MRRITAKGILFASVAVAALSGSAEAVHFHGWYVGLEGGLEQVQDLDVVRQVGPIGGVLGPNLNEVDDFEMGWAVLATAGYAFDNNWRLEGEVGYRADNIGVVHNAGGFPLPGLTGDLDELTFMGNLLYDLRILPNLSLSLGFGAGMDRASLQTHGPATNFDDAEWSFAYQAIVGVNQKLGTRWDLFATYRYLRVTGPDFDANGTQAGPKHIVVHSDDIEKESLTVGVRYDLQEDSAPVMETPPAPPPPPPAPVHFIVFFGFNKCNITAEADAVLSEAAAAAKSTGAASIAIVGHTDTSGSPAYNQKLSECRADAAKSNLVGKGVPAGAISANGKGETELMVQTGDGVKEPQNRRATIDVR